MSFLHKHAHYVKQGAYLLSAGGVGRPGLRVWGCSVLSGTAHTSESMAEWFGALWRSSTLTFPILHQHSTLANVMTTNQLIPQHIHLHHTPSHPYSRQNFLTTIKPQIKWLNIIGPFLWAKRVHFLWMGPAQFQMSMERLMSDH